MKREKMSFDEFKTWANAAKKLGARVIFGPGSKAPEEFKKYIAELWASQDQEHQLENAKSLEVK